MEGRLSSLWGGHSLKDPEEDMDVSPLPSALPLAMREPKKPGNTLTFTTLPVRHSYYSHFTNEQSKPTKVTLPRSHPAAKVSRVGVLSNPLPPASGEPFQI